MWRMRIFDGTCQFFIFRRSIVARICDDGEHGGEAATLQPQKTASTMESVAALRHGSILLDSRVKKISAQWGVHEDEQTDTVCTSGGRRSGTSAVRHGAGG
jgi:hypothetical protein